MCVCRSALAERDAIFPALIASLFCLMVVSLLTRGPSQCNCGWKTDGMKSRCDKGFRSAPKQGSPVDAVVQRAITHHQAGRLPEAEAGYREVLASKPDDAVALHYLGVIAYQVGQYEVALELMDAALRSNPKYADAYSNRGITLHAMRRYEDAVASYDEALRLNPRRLMRIAPREFAV